MKVKDERTRRYIHLPFLSPPASAFCNKHSPKYLSFTTARQPSQPMLEKGSVILLPEMVKGDLMIEVASHRAVDVHHS